MKKSFLLSCRLVCLGWLVSSPLFAQIEQLMVTPNNGTEADGNSATFLFPDKKGSFRLVSNPKPLPGSTLLPTGWYKSFWIMGDGNFVHYPTLPPNDAQMDATTHNLSYTYGEAGTYHPTVYLTEKYSNDIPPALLKTTVNAGTGTGHPANTETQTLFNGDQMSITPNHQPRMRHSTVLAVSWDKNLTAANRLVVFYNGYRDQSSQQILRDPATPTPINMYQTAEIPNYYSGAGVGVIEKTISSTDIFHTEFGIKYRNYVEYVIPASPPTPPYVNFNERGIFPVFKTNDLMNTSMQHCEMAFHAYLMRVDTTKKTYEKLANQEYTDFVATAHDPNSMTIDPVYDDLGGGNYRVRFTLTICNDGAITTDGIMVKIKPILSPAEFNVPCQIISTTIQTSSPPTVTYDPSLHTWTMLFPDGVIDPAPPNSQNHQDLCEQVTFSILTTAAGLNLLRQTDPNQRPIQSCVLFENGPPNDWHCTVNPPLPQPKPDPNPEPDKPDWVLWLTLFGLFFIGILWIFVGKIFKK